MIFINKALLSYNGASTVSNEVAGELISPLTLSKSAAPTSYTADGAAVYTITITNSAATAFAGLTLLDDLGMYDFVGYPRFPLLYEDGSASLTFYSAAGKAAGEVTAQSTANGVLFTFDIPANSTAVLQYTAEITAFAPLAAGSEITNSAVLSGAAPLLPLAAQYALPIEQSAALTITKCAQSSAAVGQPMTFTFTISNYGNTATQSGDYIVLSDQLDPPLTDISVTADGEPWTEGTQYVYDEALYYFQTQYGAISLGAAEFSQDSFGRWNATPASMVIAVTGTVAQTPASQPLIEVRPAYADPALTAQRLQNDLYLLSGQSQSAPAFAINTSPNSPIELTAPSDSHFSLKNNVLTIDTAGVAGLISAFIFVEYGEGFIMRADYYV